VDYDRIKNENKDPNIKIINLMHSNIEEVTDAIYSCKRIVSSSLHGVIVSQAYGIPAIWTKLSNKLSGDGVKFDDYFLSVGIKPYQPQNYTGRPLPNKGGLIKMVDDMSEYSKIISFDSDKLLEACPFNK
jgi:hypothetical protein